MRIIYIEMIHFTQEQIIEYNKAFQEGFGEGENQLSEDSTTLDDLRNFFKSKLEQGKGGILFENGYLRGYIIGRKMMQDQKIDITSKGNFNIKTLKPHDIRELMKMNMENMDKKHSDKLVNKLYFDFVDEIPKDEMPMEEYGEYMDDFILTPGEIDALIEADNKNMLSGEIDALIEADNKNMQNESTDNSKRKNTGSQSTSNSKRTRFGGKSKRKSKKSKRTRKSKKSKK
jgi:hypothetical protein